MSGFSLDRHPLGLKMITTSQQHRWSTLLRYKLETYIIKTRINFRVSDPMRSLLINSILIEVVPKQSRQIGYEGLLCSFPDNAFYYCFHPQQIQSSECKSPENFTSWQIYKEGKKHFHQSLNVADNPLPTFTALEEHCKNQGCKESIPLPGRRWASLRPCPFQHTQFWVSRSQHPLLQEQQVI